MAFIEYVKSHYQDQHKAKPLALTCVTEAKNVRIQKQAKERRSRRIDAFILNRDMEDEDGAPLSPQTEGPMPKQDEVIDPRKKQMLQWKEERMKRKKLEPKKPPPFKVGVVKHAFAPFQEDIFKNPLIGAPPLPSIQCNHRVTRSTTRANNKESAAVYSSFIPLHQQKSFAPPNAKFHAPKVNVIQKINPKLKYTKKTNQEPPIKLLPSSNSKNVRGIENKTKKAFDFRVDQKYTVESKQLNKRNNTRATRGQKARKPDGNNEMELKNTSANDLNDSLNKTPSYKAVVSRPLSAKASKADSVVSKGDETTKTDMHNTSLPTSPNRSVRSRPSPVKTPKMNSNELNSCVENSNSSKDLVISSPYVTVARGKANRERETIFKAKLGYTEMSPEKTAQYFRLQLDGEIIRLQKKCETWKNYQQENEELSEETNDLINLAVGQTQLLMRQKLKQFRHLIIQCENREEGKEIVTTGDLHGFWDMVYKQVENVDVRFNKLEESKSKNWQDEDAAPVTKPKKKLPAKSKPAVKNAKSSSRLQALIQAARMKSKVLTGETVIINHLTPKKDQTITFNGGFFSVVSPLKNTEKTETPSRQMNLRNSLIASEAKKRLSTRTPPSAKAILKVSHLAKNVAQGTVETDFPVAAIDFNKTPGKSILKTPATNKKSDRKRKSVKILFMDQESDDEILPPAKRASRASAGFKRIIPDIQVDFTNSETNDGSNKGVNQVLADVHVNSKIEEENHKDAVVEGKKSKRRKGRLARQCAVQDEENVPPSVVITDIEYKTKRTGKKQPQSENILDINMSSIDNNTNDKETSIPAKLSRRSSNIAKESQSDPKLNESLKKNPEIKLSRRQSLDGRQSFDLISFSPVYNTRNAIRKKSTSATVVDA